jgi:hypothetical protein
MQGIIEEYRRRAKEYRRQAERAPEYSYAQYLIELALVYEQEALDLEQSRTGPSDPEGSRT